MTADCCSYITSLSPSLFPSPNAPKLSSCIMKRVAVLFGIGLQSFLYLASALPPPPNRIIVKNRAAAGGGGRNGTRAHEPQNLPGLSSFVVPAGFPTQIYPYVLLLVVSSSSLLTWIDHIITCRQNPHNSRSRSSRIPSTMSSSRPILPIHSTSPLPETRR